MRLVSIFTLSLLSVAAHAVAPLVIYDNALQGGFANGTWANSADYSLANTSPTYAGSADSIRFVARGWGGLQFTNNTTEFNLLDYQNVTFHVHGGTSGGQKLQMYVCDNYNAIGPAVGVASLIPGGGGIPVNAWATATLDFDSAGLTFGTFNCFVIMDADGGNDVANGQPPAYIDQIVFNPRTTPPPAGATVSVSVNLTANVHPLSPLIFGVAYGNSARNAQMGYTVDRWGGNGATRYNWQVDVHSTAQDYFWENIPGSSDRTHIPPLNNDADAFIGAALGSDIQPLMTIPTIGWTPRSDSPTSHPYFAGFSVAKYGAQVPRPYTNDAVDPYDTDAGSGDCNPSSNSSPNCVLYDANNGLYHLINNDPHDTSSVVDQNFQKDWVAHMQSAHGTAASGGVKFFTLDNEVMLWNSTHRDLHPNGPTYNEIWGTAVAYGTAIKQQEPDALVTGPVTWGYCDLFTSADDATRGNCLTGTDRSAHGGLPFVAWYLQQVCANPLAGGKHLVDYIDLHYYPQGTNVALNNDDSAATAARRLKSVKELYDPTWVADSWMGTLGDTDANHYNKPNLIPRVRAWINQYCPGTKLAITEYNWGNDNTGSGAVAQAEVLAIFAREGVDMATRWVAPDPSTKAERGFSIFLNYNGAGAKVTGDSVAATSANVDQIGAYAFHDSQRTMVLLTNKDTVTHDVALTFDSAHSGTWTLYGFTGASALTQTGTGSINSASLTLSALPPVSASLLVIPDIDEIFKDGFGG
jgi:hypothetical protein